MLSSSSPPVKIFLEGFANIKTESLSGSLVVALIKRKRDLWLVRAPGFSLYLNSLASLDESSTLTLQCACCLIVVPLHA